MRDKTKITILYCLESLQMNPEILEKMDLNEERLIEVIQEIQDEEDEE